ncbi:hypothetical protein MT418_008311, partial [Batrachochytrium dendrobatidis]
MVNWFILRKDLYFAGKVNGGSPTRRGYGAPSISIFWFGIGPLILLMTKQLRPLVTSYPEIKVPSSGLKQSIWPNRGYACRESSGSPNQSARLDPATPEPEGLSFVFYLPSPIFFYSSNFEYQKGVIIPLGGRPEGHRFFILDRSQSCVVSHHGSKLQSLTDIQGVEHRLRKERIELRPRIQSRPMGLRRPPVLGFQIDGGSPPTVPP